MAQPKDTEQGMSAPLPFLAIMAIVVIVVLTALILTEIFYLASGPVTVLPPVTTEPVSPTPGAPSPPPAQPQSPLN